MAINLPLTTLLAMLPLTLLTPLHAMICGRPWRKDIPTREPWWNWKASRSKHCWIKAAQCLSFLKSYAISWG
jgi:hypothetical protein